jgi:hypothetical protein
MARSLLTKLLVQPFTFMITSVLSPALGAVSGRASDSLQLQGSLLPQAKQTW